MTHVKHLGFELELRVQQIIHALSHVPEDKRLPVIESLSPVAVKRAVADWFGIDL